MPKKKNDNWETIKLKKAIIEKVRKNKEKTFVPISTFFEKAAEEKLIGITGWAIDIGKCTTKEMKEFLRLWEKIKPIPLHRNKNTNE